MVEIVKPADAESVAIFPPFHLYQRPLREKGSILWPEFKLIDEFHPKKWGRKRVYYLAFGIDARRLRRDTEAKLLRDYHPDIYCELEDFLCATYTVAWLLDPEIGWFVSERDITAERERLEAVRLQTAARRAAGAVRRP